MGVYIKGMDKPSECDLCQFENYGYCLTLGSYIEAEHGIDSRCPLIEVKAPHGDLIDRGELQSRVSEEYRAWDEDYDALQILGDIEDAPTVIEAEVE